MHTRQGGAAHVPIMFFLLLLVMFLGALGFAYVKLTENGDLIKQRNDAVAEATVMREKGLLIEHYIEDIGRVIGKPGKYTGRPQSQSVYNGATIDYAGLMNPDEIRDVMNTACANAKLSVASGLENVLGSMVTRLSQMEQRVKDIESERDKAIAEKSAVDSKFQATTNDVRRTSQEWSQNLESTRSEFDAAKTQKDGTISNLTQNLHDKQDELAKEKETAAANEKALRAELAKKDMHNTALIAKDQMRNAPDVADGKVIVARTRVASAFIDLGKKDMLQPGTIFRIKNPNSKEVKGYGTVTRVEDERAEISLSGITDPVGDYIREGDLLYNDLYTPRASRTIFLMGRFSAPYEKDPLAALLKRLGNKVVTTMGPGVDTVILGDDPVNDAGDGFAAVKDSAEYKEALGLGVEFAPLKKIRDLIKL
jgi:hypothetical protein